MLRPRAPNPDEATMAEVTRHSRGTVTPELLEDLDQAIFNLAGVPFTLAEWQSMKARRAKQVILGLLKVHPADLEGIRVHFITLHNQSRMLTHAVANFDELRDYMNTLILMHGYLNAHRLLTGLWLSGHVEMVPCSGEAVKWLWVKDYRARRCNASTFL